MKKSSKPKVVDPLIEASQKVAFEKALSSDHPRRQHDNKVVHAPRGPPAIRLLDKADILVLTGMSFPTIWSWMRRGQFPRSRIIGRGRQSKSVWRSDEVEAWLANLPVRSLKGDTPPEAG